MSHSLFHFWGFPVQKCGPGQQDRQVVFLAGAPSDILGERTKTVIGLSMTLFPHALRYLR
jgi:hypothetical protein